MRLGVLIVLLSMALAGPAQAVEWSGHWGSMEPRLDIEVPVFGMTAAAAGLFQVGAGIAALFRAPRAFDVFVGSSVVTMSALFGLASLGGIRHDLLRSRDGPGMEERLKAGFLLLLIGSSAAWSAWGALSGVIGFFEGHALGGGDVRAPGGADDRGDPSGGVRGAARAARRGGASVHGAGAAGRDCGDLLMRWALIAAVLLASTPAQAQFFGYPRGFFGDDDDDAGPIVAPLRGQNLVPTNTLLWLVWRTELEPLAPESVTARWKEVELSAELVGRIDSRDGVILAFGLPEELGPIPRWCSSPAGPGSG
ncbi:MAG: hypothetical protein GY898_08630 [Proteobacteria bacterium]|nr:hypothetical protein [Pseudomonadota bacterium]